MPQAILLGITLLSSFSAMGQLTSFSSQYSTPGSDDTRIYGVTKTLNNKLLTVGVQQTSTGLAGAATYPGYLSRYQDMRLLQTDLDGNVLFNRIVGTPYDDRAFESVRGRLGEMIVVGHSGQGYTRADRQALGLAPNVNNAAVAILRLSSTGALLSQRHFDLGGFDDHAFSIVRRSNESFFILGRSFRNNFDKNVITFMQANGNGELVSASIIHDNFDSNILPRKMIRTNDGGFLIAAVKEEQGGPQIGSPDPVSWSMEGSGIFLVKLDINENLVFTRFVKPLTSGSYLMGVKDMVEDQSGNVVVVGTSSEGDYILKMNAAGTIIQAKAFAFGPGIMNVTPNCILRHGSGFMVSGFTPNGGVPRVILDANLNVLSTHRHHFGKEIYALENFSGGLQFYGGTQNHSLLLKWPQGGAICWEDEDSTVLLDFPIVQQWVTMQKSPSVFTEVDNASTSTPVTTRQNNCIVMTKTSLAEEAASDMATVSVFPNPAQDQLQLFVPGEEDAAYTLHDLQGRMLAAGTLRPGSQSLPVSDLESGVYLLRIQGPGGLSTHKLSIQH